MDSANQAERLSDPVVLLFQSSPFGTLDAIVQHDGKSVYFYLNQPQESSPADRPVFGTRACWVRNLQAGPLVLNEDEMKQGISPMLPRTQCVDRDAQLVPSADHLQIVWFEEGNGAALIETRPDSARKTLAVIPPWSGLEGFHGYAAACAIDSPICSPMPDNPKLNQRIERAEQFWAQWEKQPNEMAEFADDPFAQLQPKILQAYDKKFSNDEAPQEPKYFAIDGGQFPPRGLIQYETGTDIVLATVGMSVCPQPAVELLTDNPMNYRRIELALRLPTDSTPESIKAVTIQFSGLAAYPWKHFTWFGPGHTCVMHDAAPNCDSALLVHDDQLTQSLTDRASFPDFRDDPISLLWLVPITNSDQQQLQNQTITVDEIVAAYRSH